MLSILAGDTTMWSFGVWSADRSSSFGVFGAPWGGQFICLRHSRDLLDKKPEAARYYEKSLLS